jgi:tetratricopeptide (TPR) repeat protein
MLFIFCALCCALAPAIAQQTRDSFTLAYHSPLEKEAFGCLSDKKPDSDAVLALLLAVEPDNGPEQIAHARQALSSLIQALDEQKMAGKKYKKAVEILFKVVHQRQLVQYSAQAQFNDLFSGGVYNCVTASALYALLLEHYQIPYALLEYPDHVRIIVDPGKENIILESTNPVDGVYKINKTAIVQSLMDQKLIPKAQLNAQTTEALYADYTAESEHKIDFVQLTGVLYYNAAYFAFEAEQYANALGLIEKSLSLFPSKSFEQTRLAILLKLLLRASPDKPESYDASFALLDEELVQDHARQFIIEKFEQASFGYLTTENKPKQYRALYRYFTAKLARHSGLLSEIRFIHYKVSGLSLVYQNHNKSALSHWDSAYQIKPDHLQLQKMIAEAVYKQLLSVSSYQERLKEELSLWQSKFPFLESDPVVRDVRLYQAGMTVVAYFDKGEIDAGFQVFSAFEKQIQTMEERNVNFEAIVGTVYGAISSHYVRKDDLVKAEKWLEKGTAFAPASEELRRKKEAIDDYKIKYVKPARKN